MKVAATVAGTRFVVADENVRLTPAIGWLPLTGCADRTRATDQARDAVRRALRHRDLRPVEDTLREIAARDPRLVLLPVAGSTSKAQNINAAVTASAASSSGSSTPTTIPPAPPSRTPGTGCPTAMTWSRATTP
ncbi:hypothetical protein AB0C96_13800 [Streptomyces sp. NPDC048506]|uniref:hypothetical protein n=1 Tax=Streptomyces sp. NPDC048506 TaxID=3155028 RepID=UPI00341D170D